MNTQKSIIKKFLPLIIFLSVILALTLIFFLKPIYFGKDVNISDVGYIYVLNKSTGTHFYINDEDSIKYVYDNISNTSMHRKKASLDEVNEGYRLSFYNKDTYKNLDEYYVTSDSEIIDGIMVYKCKNKLCYDFIAKYPETQIDYPNPITLSDGTIYGRTIVNFHVNYSLLELVPITNLDMGDGIYGIEGATVRVGMTKYPEGYVRASDGNWYYYYPAIIGDGIIN